MFDKESIKALQAGAAIEQANQALAIAATAHHVATLPDNFVLHDLEKNQPLRRRARGVMTTDALGSFTTYVKAHAEPGASVFIDTENMRATSVLNLGTPDMPGQTDNLARYTPEKTAPYAALLATANGLGRKQVEIAEFFEDWPGHLTFFAGNDTVEPPKAIAAIRKLTIESMKKLESSEQQLSASRSAFESVQATSETPIPTTIYFKCHPYSVLQTRVFVLRLAIHTGNDKPAVSLRIQTLDVHKEEMGSELSGVIAGSFGEAGLPILLGKYEATR